MSNVWFARPDLNKVLPMYYLIRDAIAGEPTVKAKMSAYLPIPNAADTSHENVERYNAYIKRAVFYNVTRRTLLGLVGQVFAYDPVIEAPPLLDPVIANATGGGVSLVQLSKKAISYNLAYSRGGVFVDYPSTDGGATLAELKAGKIRPTINTFSPMEIINWRTTNIGAEEVLSLVVIFEKWCAFDDGFEMKMAGQFRVLSLDENGNYKHDVWREPQPNFITGDKVPTGNYKIHETFEPKDENGNPIKRIPFMFYGANNNDSDIDDPSFYDLASLNMAHYRNSADYEESCFIVGQPTPVLTGLTKDWMESELGGTIDFGSRGGIPLPVGGDAKLLQAEDNTMIKEAMDTKERQMVALGARLVEQKQVQRTATEASLESATQTSTLTSATKNVSEAFEWALKLATKWAGQSDSDVKFKLNTDFDIAKVTNEERLETVSEWQKGAITFEEMRAVLRKADVATVDDEKALIEIQNEMTTAMGTANAQ